VPSGDVLPEQMDEQFSILCGLSKRYPDPGRHVPSTHPKAGEILPAIHLNRQRFRISPSSSNIACSISSACIVQIIPILPRPPIFLSPPHF